MPLHAFPNLSTHPAVLGLLMTIISFNDHHRLLMKFDDAMAWPATNTTTTTTTFFAFAETTTVVDS